MFIIYILLYITYIYKSTTNGGFNGKIIEQLDLGFRMNKSLNNGLNPGVIHVGQMGINHHRKFQPTAIPSPLSHSCWSFSLTSKSSETLSAFNASEASASASARATAPAAVRRQRSATNQSSFSGFSRGVGPQRKHPEKWGKKQ